MPNRHTDRSYDEELGRLNLLLAEMGGVVEKQLVDSVQAMTRRDSDLAETVIASDRKVDELDQEIEAFTVRMLALRQPMATDLRTIVGALRIANDLERMGDYAKNIAKRTLALNQTFPVAPAKAVPRIARLVEVMLHDVLDAFIRRDAQKAVAVWQSDEEVDSLYTSLFRELLTYMMEDSRTITTCTHLLFIAKNIERIGDHVTNIAENVHYLVTGDRLGEGRPKGDTSSFEVVKPSGE